MGANGGGVIPNSHVHLWDRRHTPAALEDR
jgi:hypothetical protein